MKKFVYKNIKSLLAVVILVGLFIFFSWLSHSYATELANSDFARRKLGPVLYFLISILSVVLAGLSAAPLIPLANALWGFWATLFLTSTGWAIGSLIAFLLARRYGERLVCRLVNKCDFGEYRKNIKTKGLFWHILLARIILPVDIISYVIGLFTQVSWQVFLSASFIGSSIFVALAIVAADLSTGYQLFLGALIVLLFFYRLEPLLKSYLKK